MATPAKTKKRPRGPRMSAEERRQAVLDVAIDEFAARGLHGTPTDEIASKAGISHAYLFRLFPTKTELFLAVTERCFDRVMDAFAKATEGVGPGEKRLAAMGQAYVAMLDDRARLLGQLQAYAACADPVVRKTVRRRWQELYDFVARDPDLDSQQVRDFFAKGMLLTVAAAMDLFALDEVWAERLMPQP
jgi:AcrR family transcriptional regulator